MTEQKYEWLGRKEAARHLATLGHEIAVATLAGWAANGNAGKGPPFFRDGWNRTRYRKDELEVWSKKRLVRVE